MLSIHRLLGAWTLIAKSMGLMLSVGSGMMVGKEGPCVHLACCTANLVPCVCVCMCVCVCVCV